MPLWQLRSEALGGRAKGKHEQKQKRGLSLSVVLVRSGIVIVSYCIISWYNNLIEEPSDFDLEAFVEFD